MFTEQRFARNTNILSAHDAALKFRKLLTSVLL